MLKSDKYKNGVVLSFDLLQQQLKKYYSAISPKNAYNKIKNFLKINGF